MNEIRFQGSSDDNFQILGAIDDEVGCYDDCVILQVKTPDDRPVNVVGEYGRHGKGGWMIGLQVPDDGQWPSWAGGDNILWTLARSGYSPLLTFAHVPMGTTITQLWPEAGECEECDRPHDPKVWIVK